MPGRTWGVVMLWAWGQRACQRWCCGGTAPPASRRRNGGVGGGWAGAAACYWLVGRLGKGVGWGYLGVVLYVYVLVHMCSYPLSKLVVESHGEESGGEAVYLRIQI